jgi:hypothetical protein
MKARNTLALALALTVTAGLMIPPAEAQNVERLLRDALGLRRGGSGLMPNQVTIQNNVNTGILNLQNQIQADLASGRINAAHAASLQAQLSQIMSLRDQAMMYGGYTSAQVNQILSMFQQMNSQLASLQNSGNMYGWNANFGNLGSLQTSVLARINADAARGMLTPAQAQLLRNQYNRIISSGASRHSVRVRLQALNDRVTQFENQTAGRGGFWY